MPNTVDLSGLHVDPNKQLSLVQANQMSMEDYLLALRTAQGVTAGWDASHKKYTMNFGRGLKDPFGSDLTIPELEQVVKSLMPSPLRSAGKTIILQGPMPGWVSGLVKGICYKAHVVVEALDRAQGGMLVEVHLAPTERDHVRLVNPDTHEREQTAAQRRVFVQTSQLSYYRHEKASHFAYTDLLELVFLETEDTRSGEPMARVRDSHRYYAWVYNLDDLIDAEV